MIEENKWRAARYGIDGKLIDFGKEKEVATKQLIPELLEFVDDVVDELGSRSAVEHVHTILRDGTSAERQMRVFEKHLVMETKAGVMEGRTSTAGG